MSSSSRFSVVSAALCVLAAAAAVSGGPSQKPERMQVSIGVRRYDGNWWLLPGFVEKEFKVPAGQDLSAYIASLPNNERPLTLENGAPDILNDGNAWVVVRSPTSQEEIAFLLTKNGVQSFRPPTEQPPIVVPGSDSITTLENVLTEETTFDELTQIAKQIGAGKTTGAFESAYKGTHFVVDFVVKITGDNTLKRKDEWPASFVELDACFPQSPFKRS